MNGDVVSDTFRDNLFQQFTGTLHEAYWSVRFWGAVVQFVGFRDGDDGRMFPGVDAFR